MPRFLRFRHSSLDHLGRAVDRCAASLSRGARVLDAGAGHCPYKSRFEHAAYESADFCQVDRRYAAIDHVCDLRRIPVDDGRFDAVLCTQVMEHVPDPQAVIHEFARVLRPGGALWLSAPLYYEEHERPYDFFRYTQYGLRQLLQTAGFEVESLEWLEGYGAALGHQLRKASRQLSVRPSDYGGGPLGWLGAAVSLVARPAFGLLGRWYNLLDRRHRYTDGGHCINYFVTARKLAPAARADLPTAA